MKVKLLALIKNPSGFMGLALVLFWILVAVCAPVLAPPSDLDDPYMMLRHGFSTLPTPPDPTSIWGTTSGGYDIFYGIVWGSRTALIIGLTTVVFTALIGSLVGGISSFYGGYVDYVVMRLIDLFMSIPFLIAVIVMTTVLGKGIDKIIVALIVFGWHRYARVIRSEVLVVKEQDFILAAKSMGISQMKIFFKHIIPNAIQPIIVLMSINIGRMVLVAASLSFVGIGSESGFSDWGQMLNFSRNWIGGTPMNPFLYWYTYTYPSIAILTFVLGWTLLGDGLRDVYDR
jgi:peptide/nickel transport system permease protein